MNKKNSKLSFKGQLSCCPLLFLSILLVLLPTCSKKQSPSGTDDFKKPHFKSFVNQAKECEISTPVSYKLIKFDAKTSHASFFIYQGTSTLESAIKFYTRELEISGWNFKNLSTKQEGLFVANKASKTSVISIRQQESSGSKIFITIEAENTPDDAQSLDLINKPES